MDVLSSAIAKAALPVEDLSRARAFYAEKLGLTPTREIEGALFYEGMATAGFFSSPPVDVLQDNTPRLPGS